MQDQRAIMHRMWQHASRYDRLATWGKKHLNNFGAKRFLFFWKFKNIRLRIAKHESNRYIYATMAIGISKRLNAQKRAEVRRRKLDH